MYLLGYDIGSSSIKCSLVDAQSGLCAAQASYPAHEAPISAPQQGWAEQDPENWWQYVHIVTQQVLQKTKATGSDIAAIGISYPFRDHDEGPVVLKFILPLPAPNGHLKLPGLTAAGERLVMLHSLFFSSPR